MAQPTSTTTTAMWRSEQSLDMSAVMAAARRKQASEFVDLLAAVHTHMLPLAPYRTSHRRKVELFEADIARALQQVPSPASSDGSGEEPLAFVVACIEVMVGDSKHNTRSPQFGSILLCLLHGLQQVQATPPASASAPALATRIADDLTLWFKATAKEGTISLPAARALLQAAPPVVLEPSVVAAYLQRSLQLQLGASVVATDALQLLTMYPAALAHLSQPASSAMVQALSSDLGTSAAAEQVEALLAKAATSKGSGKTTKAGDAVVRALVDVMLADDDWDGARGLAARHPGSVDMATVEERITRRAVELDVAERRFDRAIERARKSPAVALYTIETVAKVNVLVARTLAASLGIDMDKVPAIGAGSGAGRAGGGAGGGAGAGAGAGAGGRTTLPGSTVPQLQFLELRVPLDKVHLVDSLQSVKAMGEAFEALVAASTPLVVGLDAEWRPHFAAADGDHTVVPALLQLGVMTDVFLVDLHTLFSSSTAPSAASAELNTVLTWLCGRRDVVKVGFGLRTDFRHLCTGIPGLTAFQTVQSVLELRTVAPAVLGITGAAATKFGLSALVKRVYGRGLNKGAQLSDWEARPLLPQQIVYAANDAHILVRLARLLATKAAQAGKRLWDMTESWTLSGGKTTAKAAAVAASKGSSSTPATTSTASVPGATLLWHPFAELQTSAATATVQVVAAAVSTAIAGGAQASPCLAILPAAGAGVSSKAADGEAAWHVASRHYMEQAQTVFNLPDGAVLKTVACFVDDQPVVAVLSGNRSLQRSAVAAVLGGNKKTSVRIASPAEVVDAFGSKPGSLSPLCLLCGDGTASEVVGTVLVDTALADYDQVAFGAGDERSFMVTDLATLLNVLGTEAKLVPVSKPTTASSVPATSAAATDSTSDGAQKLPEIGVAFLSDGSNGKLVKWLRVLGVDVEEAALPPGAKAAAVAKALVAAAQASQRVLLTHSKKLAARKVFKGDKSILLLTHSVPSQLDEIAAVYPALTPRRKYLTEQSGAASHAPFSRCVKCNGPGFRAVSREEVVGRVPEYTARTAPEFTECVTCHQVFWPGTIYENAKKTMT